MVETKLGLEALPDSARIWIYQSNRALTANEGVQLETAANQFVSGWNAHGQQLSAGFEFLHNHFLILAVDESIHGASGCSIDSSVALIRQLNAVFQIDFLDRTKVAMLENGQVELLDLSEIKNAVATGKLTPESKVFNNLLRTLGEFRNKWVVSALETWLKRYFN
jgi:hypothetical protein